jgi:WD repeat-containing protein 61
LLYFRESPAPEEEILEYVVSGGLDDMVKVWEYRDEISGENTLKLRNSWDGHYLGVVSVDVSTEGTSAYL